MASVVDGCALFREMEIDSFGNFISPQAILSGVGDEDGVLGLNADVLLTVMDGWQILCLDERSRMLSFSGNESREKRVCNECEGRGCGCGGDSVGWDCVAVFG